LQDQQKINIEIKTSKWLDFKTARLVAKNLKERNLESRAMISAFNPLTLCFIKIFFSSILTGYIVKKKFMIPFIYIAKPDFLHPISNLVTDRLLRFAKRKGLRVNVWTVNTKPAIDWLIQKEVDGIITDRLEFYVKR
jgi:glycerophosphoryl diester phosphodiesterase